MQNAKEKLAELRARLREARIANDVASDRAALRALGELEARIDAIARDLERLERDPTPHAYAAARQVLSEAYRAVGDLQAVTASAGTRRGGYKGSATTNAARSLSIDQRGKIQSAFEKAIASGMAKETAYRQLARGHRVSDRTIRRVVTGNR